MPAKTCAIHAEIGLKSNCRRGLYSGKCRISGKPWRAARALACSAERTGMSKKCRGADLGEGRGDQNAFAIPTG